MDAAAPWICLAMTIVFGVLWIREMHAHSKTEQEYGRLWDQTHGVGPDRERLQPPKETP